MERQFGTHIVPGSCSRWTDKDRVSVEKFCKEVHHEKQRQRAKPFWQWFRNKDAREMHERKVSELRSEWICHNDKDVNDLAEALNNKKFFWKE